MKRFIEFFKGLISLLIISLIFGSILGGYQYHSLYNAIIESHLNEGVDVPIGEELLYGEYSQLEHIIFNIIKNDQPFFHIESDGSQISVTLTPFVLLIICLLIPSLLFFTYLFVIYLFIEIIDIIRYLNKKRADKSREKMTYSDNPTDDKLL